MRIVGDGVDADPNSELNDSLGTERLFAERFNDRGCFTVSDPSITVSITPDAKRDASNFESPYWAKQKGVFPKQATCLQKAVEMKSSTANYSLAIALLKKVEQNDLDIQAVVWDQ
jgi:hypothetical protein